MRHGARRLDRLLVHAAALCALLVCPFGALPAAAAERYALLVVGAAGGDVFAAQYQEWRTGLVNGLRQPLGFPDANIVVLASDFDGPSRATAANVRTALGDLARRVRADDLVLVFLMGHSTVDGNDPKFNLVGPDLTADEWGRMLDALAGRVVLVNSSESSYPFLESLSRRGRVVITATETAAQRFATVFPNYFVQSLVDPAADADKDGRLSVWELFAWTSRGVRQYYEQRGQLATERPVIDDDGNHVGRDVESPGKDGDLARVIYLNPPAAGRGSDDQQTAVLRAERQRIEESIAALKQRRGELDEAEYTKRLEQLLVDLARVSRRLRQPS